jgi:hypothetical protein
MIESSAYYEAYRHVLKQLQAMDLWEGIPMEEFIIHGNSKNIRQPTYAASMI